MEEDKLRAFMDPWQRDISIYWRRGKRLVGDDLLEVEVTPGDHHRPTLYLSGRDAQQLMDDLWACGLRPTEGSGSAGAMSAVQEHLKDLRRLLFDDPRTKPPGEPLVAMT